MASTQARVQPDADTGVNGSGQRENQQLAAFVLTLAFFVFCQRGGKKNSNFYQSKLSWGTLSAGRTLLI